MRRKTAGTNQLPENLYDLRVTGNFSDHLFVCFWHEWRGIVCGQLLVPLVKFRIRVDLAKCFAENLYALFGRAWREHEWFCHPFK